jgi:hypothetical protein
MLLGLSSSFFNPELFGGDLYRHSLDQGLLLFLQLQIFAILGGAGRLCPFFDLRVSSGSNLSVDRHGVLQVVNLLLRVVVVAGSGWSLFDRLCKIGYKRLQGNFIVILLIRSWVSLRILNVLNLLPLLCER